MDYFAGLDVSVNDTNVCIVDDTGKIVREMKAASETSTAAGHGRIVYLWRRAADGVRHTTTNELANLTLTKPGSDPACCCLFSVPVHMRNRSGRC